MSIDNKYYVRYRGEVMTMAEFARTIGADYEKLRDRARLGYDLFRPARMDWDSEKPEIREEPSKYGGYTLEELADMYSRFKNEEDALDILADFACLHHGTRAVDNLRDEIEYYLAKKRREIRGR